MVVDAQRVSEDLRIKQERERKEIEEQIVECTYHIDDSRASYQSLINNIHQSKIISKIAENVIASARMVVAKAQALIHDNKLKVVNEKKRMEELEAAKIRHSRNLMSILRNWKLFRHNLLRRGFYPTRS